MRRLARARWRAEARGLRPKREREKERAGGLFVLMHALLVLVVVCARMLLWLMMRVDATLP